MPSPPCKIQTNNHLEWDLRDITEELETVALEGALHPLHTQSRCLKTVNTREVELKALGHQSTVVFVNKLMQAIPKLHVEDFLRARLLEHDAESRLFKAKSSDRVAQLALVKIKLRRAQLEQIMYQFAMPASSPASTPQASSMKCVKTCNPNTQCLSLEAHGQMDLITITNIMLLRQKGSPSIKGLHLEYMRGRWEEHKLESEIRAGRDPTEKQKLLLSIKRLRMEAEIACYNDVILSTSPEPILHPLYEESDDSEVYDECDDSEVYGESDDSEEKFQAEASSFTLT